MLEQLRPAEKRELDRWSCLGLLAGQCVGRLVLPGDDPHIAPVNYVVVDETLVFRADEGSRAAGAHGRHAVFEVDFIDDAERTGWSVIVKGRIEDVTGNVALDPALTDRLEPWAPGPKDRWLRLVIEEIGGRWVRAAERPFTQERRAYL